MGSAAARDAASDHGDLWIFGYGSLMWRPGFAFAERRPATLRGLHRSLCVWSHDHRGTPERPGLVLGLDRGGACRGVAFRVEAAHRDAVLAYLAIREQAGLVYHPRLRPARLDDGRAVFALAYVAERSHPLYAGVLSLQEQARIVAAAHGPSGANAEYLRNTLSHLATLGIRDDALCALVSLLDATDRPLPPRDAPSPSRCPLGRAP